MTILVFYLVNLHSSCAKDQRAISLPRRSNLREGRGRSAEDPVHWASQAERQVDARRRGNQVRRPVQRGGWPQTCLPDDQES